MFENSWIYLNEIEKKRRQKLDANGDPIEGEFEEEEEEGEDDEEAVKAFAGEQLKKLDDEKSGILGQKGLLEEERKRLLDDFESKKKRLEGEDREKIQLNDRIKLLESKLLVGGSSIRTYIYIINFHNE